MNHPRLFASVKVLVLLFLCSVLCISTNAQNPIGRQKVDRYPITSWGSLTFGLTWLPVDYNTNSSQTYPLIIFLHGAGETGDGVGGLNKLISTALPQKIAQGWNPEAVNPEDGQNYKFIVVSPQAPSSSGWSYSYGHLQWILADVLNRYRVDPSRIYVTGLSAGGAGTWGCVTNGPAFAQKIAAIVPVSSVGPNTPVEAEQLPLVGGTYGVKVWNVCGAGDAWYSFAQHATTTINNANPAPSVPAVLTGLPGIDHSSAAWNTAYERTWRSNSQNLNIFEWMLKWKRGAGTNPVAPPVNQVPAANAGVDQTINNSSVLVQLNGSGTDPDGSITSYSWSQLSGSSIVSFNNSNISTPTLTGLAAGTYTLRLTVKDNAGAVDDDDVIITVNASVNTPPSFISIPGKIEAENYTSMNGVGTENTSDAGGGLNVGWQDNNDWMDYSGNLASAGTYTLNFRVATPNTGVQFQLRNAGGTVFKTLNVPNTGGWQTWQTISTTINLPAGQQTLRIYTNDARGGWNLNWCEIQNGSTAPPPPPLPSPSNSLMIEAETYTFMSGIQTEKTADEGDGLNVGWQEDNDWMDYTVNIAAAGVYTVRFRIATTNNDVKIKIKKSDGGVLKTISIPNTGGWQTWQTITTTINLPAGQQTLRIHTHNSNGGWNINWWEIQLGSVVPPPTDGRGDGNGESDSPTQNNLKIEAEDYIQMNGIGYENTTDEGGGRNVGWQENYDWMDYAVTLSSSNTYTVQFRVASISAGIEFQLRNSSGTVLTTLTVPNTGGWQIWQTISAQVVLPAGQQTLKIYTSDARGSGWNINWWQIIAPTTGASRIVATEVNEIVTVDEGMGIFPNPVQDRFTLKISNQYTGQLRGEIYNMAGTLQKQFTIAKPNKGSIQTSLSISELKAGQYIIKIYSKEWSQTSKIIKL